MLTRLLEKYKEIEASAQITDNRNDKLDILAQILLFDKLLENLKNEDQPLLSFFSEESIFTEITRFCFGFYTDFTFSSELAKKNQNEIRNLLSLNSFQVFMNISSSLYSDLLSSNLNFNTICIDFLLHNIKFHILKICNEIINSKNDFNEINIKMLDTHFFGFFTQVIFKIMKWNFPILFLPDIYKQKFMDKKEKNSTNKENSFQSKQENPILNEKMEIQINDSINHTQIIKDLNQIIEKFGLFLTLNIDHDEKQSKSFVTISQDNSEPFFLNYKYISNLIICNIHDNYAMQEFLVDILKNYPEALPDGTIIKRLSQIACGNFTNISNCNGNNCNNNNNNNALNNEASFKNIESCDQNTNENNNCENNYHNSSNQFDFDLIFDKLKGCFCNRFDACYTLIDIYRSLPNESPIFYQYSDSTVLNNIITAASLIYDEEKDIDGSFKHKALTAGLIEIATKVINNNSKLISSVEFPPNLIISERNIDEVTISAIELYLKKNANNSLENSKSTNQSNKSNLQLSRRVSSSQHSFSSNMSNLTMLQLQSGNLVKSKSDSKNLDCHSHSIECDLFKLFFASEKLQNKLITLFFHKEPTKQSKLIFQSSSTNCISLFDSSGPFSFPSPTSSSSSFRCPSGIDCSYPRSASSTGWQNDKSNSTYEQSLLAAIASIPGLIPTLEAAFEKDKKIKMSFSLKNKSNINDSNITSSVPSFNLDFSSNSNSSFEILTVAGANNESSMITSSSYDTLDSSNSSCCLNAPRWTPACKFLALELVKLDNTNISVPELDSRKWKNVIMPAIRRFNLILESNYGSNDSLISKHRSCSMNDKAPNFTTNTSYNGSKSIDAPIFQKKPLNSSNLSNSSNRSENRINSFEKVKFSSNFLHITKEDSIPQIKINDNSEDKIDPDLPKVKFQVNDNDAEEEYNDNMIESLEIEINSDNFESDNQKKISDKSESHKNYPHSLILHDNNCFSTLGTNSLSSHAPKSPDFTLLSKPALNSTKTNSNSSSSDSSSSITNIKMSTRQTLIQKKKDTNQQQMQPSPPLSSSNSEGDDEYIIDI